MLKPIASAILFLGFAALAVLFIFFSGDFTVRTISDALFVSGGGSVLINLLILSRSGEITHPLRYAAGKWRHSRSNLQDTQENSKYNSYLDYKSQKLDELKTSKTYNYAFFIVGILMVVASFVIMPYI